MAFKPKKEIVYWRIKIEWENGETEFLDDIPGGIAVKIDEWLTDVENQRQEREDNSQ